MSAAHGGFRRIRTLDRPAPATRRDIETLIEEAAVADGRHAVSEQGRLHLRRARAGVRHLLLFEKEQPAGYAQLEETDPAEAPAAELVVHPAFRGRGHGRALTQALLAESGRRLRIWAHGGHPAARHLADALGLVLFRELRQMRRPLAGPGAPALPEPVLPGGVTVRTFVPGRDDDAWLAVNTAAFAHHPEQGAWTREDLADRIAEPWFDAGGFFLAERGGEVVGFHWTKEHPARPGDGRRLGEVYVVGVLPTEQGSGLGRALTVVGLRHLARRCPVAMLYVDADNAAAVSVYQRLGFTVHQVDLMYRTEG